MTKSGDIRDDSPITREFLENFLKRQIIDFKTSGGSNPGDNFTSILISLEIRVVGEDKPMYLLFKTFPNHPTRQKLLEDTNLFLKEYLYYSNWIPELINFQSEILRNEKILRPALPKLIAGCAIDYENAEMSLDLDGDPMINNFVLMVDERKTNGFQMADKLKSLGYFHVKTILNELAKLHALGHAYKTHKKIEKIRNAFPFMSDPFFCNPTQNETIDAMSGMNLHLIMETLQNFLDKHPMINQALHKIKKVKTSDLMFMFLNPDGVNEENVEDLMRAKPQAYAGIPPLKEQWVVPGHGDCWTNNMLFKEGKNGKIAEAVLVDLQLARESCIMADIIYFIYTSTDTEFRNEYLEEMLRWYFDKFVEYCKHLKCDTFPGFTMANFMRKFHRSKIFGYLFAVIVCPLMLCKPEGSVDLDTLDVINSDSNTEKRDDFADLIQKSSTRGEDDRKLLADRFSALLLELHQEGVL